MATVSFMYTVPVPSDERRNRVTPIFTAMSKQERETLLSLIPPIDFTRHQWLEPYFLTGDLLFELAPKRYVVSCVSSLVQEMYLRMISSSDKIWPVLKELQTVYKASGRDHSLYDDVVEKFNESVFAHYLVHEDVARMIFLKLMSRDHTYPTDWTPFDVPPCWKPYRQTLREKTFWNVADYLKQTGHYGYATILHGYSFSLVQHARCGDMVFADLRGKSVSIDNFLEIYKLLKPLTNNLVYVLLVIPDGEAFMPQKCCGTVHVKDGLRIVDNFAEVKKAHAVAERERRKVVTGKLRVLKDFGIYNPFTPEMLNQFYDVMEVSDAELDAIVRTRISNKI